jgi:hypothetical protein
MFLKFLFVGGVSLCFQARLVSERYYLRCCTEQEGIVEGRRISWCPLGGIPLPVSAHGNWSAGQGAMALGGERADEEVFFVKLAT